MRRLSRRLRLVSRRQNLHHVRRQQVPRPHHRDRMRSHVPHGLPYRRLCCHRPHLQDLRQQHHRLLAVLQRNDLHQVRRRFIPRARQAVVHVIDRLPERFLCRHRIVDVQAVLPQHRELCHVLFGRVDVHHVR